MSAVAAIPSEPLAVGRRSDWLLLRILRQGPVTAVGLVLMVVFVAGGVVGILMLWLPSLHHLYLDQTLSDALKKPLVAGHLLGTDALGRDTFSRTLAGLGVSFTIGLIVTLISLFVGMLLGLLAGYFRGIADVIVRAGVDVAWGFPIILLAVMLAGMIGPGFISVILAVALLNWAGFARIIRGYALVLREREFVDAARAIGVPSLRVILSHLLPNVMAPTLVMGSYYVASTIIIEAGLSFLGLGVQPPTPSLGQMMADGRDFLRIAPWEALIPGVTIALAVFSFNVVGDALRDIFDPRLSRPQG